MKISTADHPAVSSRRGFLKKASAVLASATAAATTPTARAAIGPGNVLTTMSITATSSVRFAGTVNVTARVSRLDGGRTGLSGIPIRFRVGNGTYAPIDLGVRYTDSTGKVVMSFAARNVQAPGRYVVIAEMNPTSCPEGVLAHPVPYAWFSVTR